MISTLSDALAERGFDTLTEVQKAVTAPDLSEADLLVSAQTGSGKTVGFGLAIAPTLLGSEERLAAPAAPLALVVAPTRELALQVQRELMWLYSKAGARVVSCIGGMDARDERRALDRGAHIVVGTPGRLRDHITRGSLDLGDIRAVVLDEADEMLDLGFREDLEFMLGEAPSDRRTLLFSATVPPAIADLAKQYQRDAVRVTTLSRGEQHTDIAYQAIQVAPADAEHAIINLLRYHDAPTSIVFANTRAAVARLAARLANRGLSVVSLSGELSQDERSHALQALRDGRARVCVATDVAARGIDLPNLDLVIHADLPTNTEALLHRSGRTGRAGRKGISALIVPDKVSKKAARLLKWAKIGAEWTFAPSPEEILALDESRLLSDPIWAAELSQTEAAFAAKLMADYGPEQIAAACLRLYRANLSAPEELNAPTARAARPERAPFGPSAWVELSIGQDRRAEARWLLPLLCRAGDLDKAQIGKIRVMPETTLVEIAEPALPGFLDRLGPEGILEDDVSARKLDAVPEGSSQPQERPARPRPASRDGAAPQRPAKPHGKPSAGRGRPVPERDAGPRAAQVPTPTPRAEEAAPTPAPRSDAEVARHPVKDKPRKARHSTLKKGWAKPKDKPRASDRADRTAEGVAKKPRGDGPAPKKRNPAADTGKRLSRKRAPMPAGGNTPPRRKV
ncbi:Helicase domain protein [Rhodovulum sp. P5]|uniref:DEAD/DEAH box helicase n=1 Tax=Rhodovulum sp. P5 TaxID=1564506 RepID=UPI0009C1C0A4|nr:DEAD/DEAH box helicase [Rhodovulum sp. P5]ARE38852.1 Helicase domain protein [Rhodovulum sp. P5]